MQSDIPVFYPNMLKLFSECPLRFYYRYSEQIPTPIPDKGFVTGKNIHSLASYYLKGMDITKFEKALTPKEAEMWSVLKNNPYFDMDIVGVEKNIIARLGDNWIGGRLDAVVKNGNSYFILDYKTGGVNSDMVYDFQTMVYLMLCHSVYEGYDSLSFIYLDLKNNKEVTIAFNDDLKIEYEKRLSDIIASITEFNPSKYEPNPDCNCEFSNICRPN